MLKEILKYAVGAVVGAGLFLALSGSGPDFAGYTTFSGINTTDGYQVDGSDVINGSGNFTGNVSPSDITYPTYTTSSTTESLTSDDLGKIVFLNYASGTTATLPSATDGAVIDFVVTSAFDTSNTIIDSAEGDNIEGVVDVNSTLVVCSGEDQVNFVNSAESLGDNIRLTSDGTSWFISGSGASAGSITCTDPS